MEKEVQMFDGQEIDVKLGEKNRVCAFKGCKTILNRRNLKKYCYRHLSVVKLQIQDAYVKSFECQPLDRAKFRRECKNLEQSSN